MSLIVQSIKNFIAGISQQPPILRHAEQLEEQINGFSTEAGGLQKRPPSVHIAKLEDNINLLSKIHIVDRDETERYIMAFTGEDIKVYDLDGKPKVVKYTGRAKEYIKTQAPRKDIKVVTVADYTFIVNRNIVAKMEDYTEGSNWDRQGILIHVRSGQYGRTYKIKLDGRTIGQYTTPDGSQSSHVQNIDTNFIANELAKSIREKLIGSYEVDVGSSWLHIKSTKATSVETEDGFNNQAMKGFIKTAQHFTDLPATAPDGFTVLIRGQANSTADDYYVRFDSKENLWRETVKPNQRNKINKDTMPHSLIRNAKGEFELKAIDWTPRSTGDDDSNPEPSFIGLKINDVFFFRNRLGIVAGESVNLSKSGEFFDYWMDSATGVIDTDPIDLSVSHNRVSTLYNAVPFNQDLYLFSAQTQFILHAEGVLSPKNAQIDQVTEFSGSTNLKPIGVGRNLYFTAERADYTTVREYFAVYDSTDSKDSTDITSHVPNLLKNRIYELIASNNENIIMALSEGTKDIIYVYKYLFLNNTKVQASWSSWKFNGDILGGNFIDSTLYFLIKRGDSVYLEKLLINYNTKDYPDIEPYRCMVDRKTKVKLSGGTYDEVNKKYTWNAKEFYKDNNIENEEYVMVLNDGRVFYGKNTIVCTSTENLEGTEVTLGTTYAFFMELSTLYLKKQEENGTITIPNYRLILRDIKINYADTGYFVVLVDAVGKPKRTYRMTGRTLGSPNNTLGKHPIDTGTFKVPIQETNTDVTIQIHNDSPLPCALNGLTWNARVSARYKQM